MTLMNKALTIAGSDTSGGAGMEADLKTMEELGIFGMTALTCIVTMHPTTWEHSVYLSSDYCRFGQRPFSEGHSAAGEEIRHRSAQAWLCD